ncbi:ABC transporter permease [Kineosporia sp. J2-2]|uniref:ABC transporter permease n=1 Tax=Kineosporia corallincola TaxID=2835133 RepID=A0ABS5TSB6_9ACTN|nr:ABC transporter permease [Kineosporia corallincola]MBT0773704.1 ABC transporter permease [Kineosporia corallincola]
MTELTHPPTEAAVVNEAAPAPRPARGPGRSRAATWRRYVLPPIGAAVLGVVIWQLVIVLFDIPTYLLPGPADVWSALTTEAGSIAAAAKVTMQEAALGFVLAMVSGFAAALFMARWNIAERGLYPYLVLLQTVPIVAVAPLFVVWFGAGITTNALVAAMIAVFPIAANTLQGLKSTDRNLVQLYRMAGAPERVQMFSLRVPAALPQILTGLRIASGASVIGAIVGEFVAGIGGGEGGLGYVITLDATQLRTPELFVAVLMASAVSLILFGIVAAVEGQLLKRWHESALPTEE